jgi:uncharacterized protein
MILETDFTVAAPSDRVWRELLDLEAFAACLPCSKLRPVDGDTVLQGTLRPEVAGSAVECIGTLRPIDVDEDGRNASCALSVRQVPGDAFATATVRSRVAAKNGLTRVSMSLDGRLAALQISEDSARGDAERLLGEFASRLERSIAERASRPAADRPLRAQAPPPTAPRPPDQLAPATALPPSAHQRLPGPAVAAAGIVGALALALLAGRRARRGARVEIRFRW